jgi:hypothetical protein
MAMMKKVRFTAFLLLAASVLAAGAGPVAASSKDGAGVRKSVSNAVPLVTRWDDLIKQAAQRFRVSESWIRAVMQMESGGKTEIAGIPITSKAGAMGVMQIMPDTYEELRREYGFGSDPYNVHDNVFAGAAYLHWLEGKFGYPAMFAAYNAGPGRLTASSSLDQLPAETQAYVGGIGRILGGKPLSIDRDDTIALTRPDGSTVSIKGSTVDSIRAPLPNEYAPGVQTVVAMGKQSQGVKEDMATVASELKKHGATQAQIRNS